MSQEWMIDVLTDLRRYARRNNLPGLAEALDDAVLVAVVELRDRAALGGVVEGHDGKAGNLHRGLEEHSFPR